jgi:rubrerythrin
MIAPPPYLHTDPEHPGSNCPGCTPLSHELDWLRSALDAATRERDEARLDVAAYQKLDAQNRDIILSHGQIIEHYRLKTIAAEVEMLAAAENEVDARLEAAEASLKECRGLLLSLEWSSRREFLTDAVYVCPVCGRPPESGYGAPPGHTTECAMGSVLSRLDGEGT